MDRIHGVLAWAEVTTVHQGRAQARDFMWLAEGVTKALPEAEARFVVSQGATLLSLRVEHQGRAVTRPLFGERRVQDAGTSEVAIVYVDLRPEQQAEWGVTDFHLPTLRRRIVDEMVKALGGKVEPVVDS